ncbi:MAG TPA: hydrogenase 4 subunit B [Burkholderiales bacterium]|jgi:formate hydrogenlyase subunit 3/multisubunit Na+/H+ antiporter MnhD subunit
MPAATASYLEVVIGIVLFWLAIGALGLLRPAHHGSSARLLYALGAVAGVALAAVALAAIGAPPQAVVLPLGLPDLPFHTRLDALSAFFLLVLGAAGAGISCYAAGYFSGAHGNGGNLTCLQYHWFLASMALVLIADDAYLFMVAWEAMALASYFLVTTDHHDPEIRKAGFLYLLIAHVGAISILLCFGVLQGGQGEYTFDAMRHAELSSRWATVAFMLALLGFGAKAGIVPLHVWLPEAHPAAPSPVSALLSGVMLKTAIYGLFRVTYDLLPSVHWEWGLLVLVIAVVTTLFGVLFALMQHDLKRLLAYHSVENIGIILIGFGLSLIYIGTGQPVLAVLGLIAALYHTLNHAIFKGLLFLGAGSVLKGAGLRDLGRMGGLIRVMPFTAFFFLIGALAISALPPLNGFVSEWLTFQAALLSPSLEHGVLRSIIPLAAAALALAGALTAMCFVKVFGVAFLGVPRSGEAIGGREASEWEQLGMGWLAVLCLVLGLAPVWMIGVMDPIALALLDYSPATIGMAAHWMWLTPVAPERASYSPLIFLAVIVAVVLAAFGLVRLLYHGRLRRTPAWDCGFPGLNARMQDTAEGFAQPIRQIFAPVYEVEAHHPDPFDRLPRYVAEVRDRFWSWLYFPIAGAATFLSRLIGRIQVGRVAVYLMYSFATIIFLLAFVR